MKDFKWVVLLAIFGNLLLWGGLIYFACWCLKHFQII